MLASFECAVETENARCEQRRRQPSIGCMAGGDMAECGEGEARRTWTGSDETSTGTEEASRLCVT
ncbi:hypothetical protein PI125_g15923 [Phytophthora idaei]|nr:hypothetical protein PI125_g15923 [Phytophthora idaei]